VAAGERDELRKVGDMMQSEASRLAEWAENAMRLHPTTLEMPYEVREALLGVKSAVHDWTGARCFNYAQRVKEDLEHGG
jgi:hypothetical protein